MKILLAILSTIIIFESTALALPYLASFHSFKTASYPRIYAQSLSFSFPLFNQPIANDTDQALNHGLSGSWEIDIQSSLLPSSQGRTTEAQMAFAPAYTSESLSIPTIIVQERADGLVRVEYFAQNWPNTYGLLLYNSTTPSWTGGRNVTLLFRSFGPPSRVNPQLAPRPNGNLDIMIGGAAVLSAYPIAWADLSKLYLYGYPGSSFIGGQIRISIYELSTS